MPLPVRLALCMAFGAGVPSIFIALAPRSDLAQQVVVPSFALEIVGFAVASGLLAVLALRGAVPAREPAAGAGVLALGLIVIAVASAVGHPRDPNVLVRTFLSVGIPCAVATCGLAVAPGLALFVALRRGVPLAPASSGALASGSALLVAYLAMRLHCPNDDGWHLLVWHTLPIVPVMAVGALIGVLWLTRWRA